MAPQWRLARLLLLMCWSSIIAGSLSSELTLSQQTTQQESIQQEATSLLAARAALRGRRAATGVDSALTDKAHVSTLAEASSVVSATTQSEQTCFKERTFCQNNADCRTCSGADKFRFVCLPEFPGMTFFKTCTAIDVLREGDNCDAREMLSWMYKVPYCEWGTSCIAQDDGLQVQFCAKPKEAGGRGAPCGPNYDGAAKLLHECNQGLTCSRDDVCE